MPISPAPAVLRANEILQHFVRRPTDSLTVSELARQVSLPRASCDSIVQALALCDLLVRDNDLRYSLGPAAITLGEAARAANSILSVSATQARSLADTLSAFAAVSLRHGSRSAVAEVFDNGPTFGLRAQVGHTIDHIPPFGAVYIAWHDDEIEAWFARSPGSLSKAERSRLETALEQVRRLGFSVALASPRHGDLDAALTTLAAQPNAQQARRARDAVVNEMVHREYLAVTDFGDETLHRVTLMAAPVFDRHGRAVASILLLGPDHDLSGAEILSRAAHLLDAAEQATRLTGGVLPPSHPRSEPSAD